MKKRGWFRNGGEAHRGWYNGFWCDSSWQLAVIIYCLEHNFEIIRNTKTFPYKFGRKIEGYKPDFIINGKYVEVKGFKDYRSKRKIEQFPFPLVIIDSQSIKPFLSYVQQKYGDDFWKLLEN